MPPVAVGLEDSTTTFSITPEQAPPTSEPETIATFESDPADLVAMAVAEPENTASEPEVITTTLPIPPSTTATEESSNWDDLEEVFDPYLGDDNTITTLERNSQVTDVSQEDQGVVDGAVGVAMEQGQTKPENIGDRA
jgi:hypothetical protein